MATLSIDNKEYDLDTLSDECKAQLASIQFVEQELARLQAKAAALQTAKGAYLQALKVALPVLNESDTNLSRTFKNLNETTNPPQVKLIALLEHYKKGQHELAQNLATSLTKAYPNHPLGWKVLGALFYQTGKLQDSVIANKKVLEISPNDAEAHSNMGITLKDLGRLKDAETSYKKAIAIKSDYAEAHYNLGITLKELGRLEDAKVSYCKAITIKPDYAEAHYNLGMTLHKLGRFQDAETSYKKAITIKPNYAEANNNLGATLQELDRLEDAETSYKKAIAIKPDYAEAHSNLGNVLKNLGRLQDSATSHKKAIAINPEYAVAYNNIGTTLQELGRMEDAETSYKKAIAIRPDLAEAHSNLGTTLQELGRLEDAETSYKKAIAIEPRNAETYFNLSNALKELGRMAEAEAGFAQAISLKSDFIKAHNEMLTCLYLMNKRSQFFDQLDYLITQNKPNSVVGSLTCRSMLKYGEEKPNIFCNEPLKHVLLVDLKSRYNFEEIFVRKAKAFLSEDKRSHKRQDLLSNGYQTSGNLFGIGNNFTDQIQKAIRSEIERYRINFESSEEGLIRKWPSEYRLYGWVISMKSGGELQPHIHEKGWLSGSIYINVPPKTKIDSGSLVVALGKDSDATNSRQNSKKVLDVVTGSMALFPASLMHHTIPFESEEERIVLAFDVVPNSH